ncbi:MAG: MoaD/ThiS family protein [Rhodospirillaceae bacterium]|jgi:molybdopterin converting factor small subunit|nr:MoaD/ThiS family protein [Rhodospirillaceae bacterium]MBT3626774.1 MoaD/ThiS family protein [Rhodospirillaceae bacterium]MBT3925543.1 MoaD/ThiS family protein [Rhodospirillaceae bacterium]MBT4427578.1 MoaD/ThiS family protein [Rhodospirillaceae bacterium]MBT5037238.1 MoaD/ThiS family protein [Rhodospirillaceae bacterium]
MKVTVKLFAQLGQYLPPDAQDNQVELDVAAGATPESIFAEFRVPPENCHLVLVNGVYIAPGQRGVHALKDKDALAVWPPIAGGNSR